MAEGARLESVCRGNSTEGSNPSVSAQPSIALAKEGLFFKDSYYSSTFSIWVLLDPFIKMAACL